MTERELVIIGSGPAGLTAALYAARANLAPVVYEGTQSGGQLMLTTEVENYPGFPDGILGPDLMDNFRTQAARFGAEIHPLDVESLDLSTRPFALEVGGETVQAQAVILATGASAKWLGLPDEARLAGRGISTCATCDGFFFRDKEIAVVGGGDSAVEEALFLTKFAGKVTLIHRRDQLRASKIMAERARANERIAFLWNSIVTDVHGEDKLESIGLEDTQTGARSTLAVDGLFVAIGHEPNTALVKGQIDLDDVGYAITHADVRTSVPGLWAAGDVQDSVWRQAVTAAGSGCMAAIDAERHLEAEKFGVAPAW
ncbi:MAG: thioredoxin-disulfide reductase [Acidimicrobiia bacterium]|nr:thioredoxin-disulfide reductase [Acidimicrobiia bacterium]